MIEHRYTLQNGATATGVGNVANTIGHAGAALQVSGTFVGTITWQATVDGANWVAVRATNLTSGTQATTATAAGIYFIPVAGLAGIRANITAYTSGTITVTTHVSEAAWQ